MVRMLYNDKPVFRLAISADEVIFSTWLEDAWPEFCQSL